MTVAKYVLRGGAEGAKRLRVLARMKWPTTKELLRRAGLRKGMHCLDLGCGSGAVTLQLARWVGSEGKAVGIDADEQSIEIARIAAFRSRKLPTFRAVRAEDLDEDSSFDFVFSRFLLSHVADPKNVLARMVRAAKPGGTIVVEDVEFSGLVCYPPCPAFDFYVEQYKQVGQRNGGDPMIGPRLLGLLRAAGLSNVQLNVVVPTFTEGEEKTMAPLTLEHIREALVEAGLATNAQIDRMVAELNDFVSDPHTIQSIPRIFQVWGRRPE